MIPGMDGPKNPGVSKDVPKSCQMIPPMIYKLPPPLEKLVDECKNETNMPADQNIKSVFGKDIKELHIEILEDFSKLYKVFFTRKNQKIVKYCNDTLSYCFDLPPKKIEKK